MATYTIKSGDTFTTIAAQSNTTVEAIQVANPGVQPTALQVGQVINLPGGVSSTNYTIKSGDTFSNIAQNLNVDVGVIINLNPGIDPTKLQVGQVIKIPSNTGSNTPLPPPTPNPTPIPPTTPPPTSSGKYTIVGGDTFTIIASRYGTDAAAIQNLNPGVNPTTLQVGQVINVPSTTPNIPTLPNGGGIGGPLVYYSGPASSFPDPRFWAPYDALWAHNSSLMRYSNSDSEIGIIGNAIPQISRESGMDARVILYGVRNTGIMQAHNGAIFNSGDPVGSITQMIRDGAVGTVNGDGLKQTYARFGNYYEALRAYNSGSVDRGNLSNGITATGDYVSKMANRLLGHVWPNM